MPLLSRFFFIAGVWVLCILICSQSPAPWSASSNGFQLDRIKAPLHNEQPLYCEEFLNEGQQLPFVHVSSVLELADHSIATLWYGGPYEHSHDNSIYFAKQQEGLWLPTHAIMSAAQAEHDLARPVKALGNPIMLSNADGSLRLIFITIAMGKWSGSQLNTCLSQDGGLTWSHAERLTLSPFFNLSELVRNRPVKTIQGWCVPIYQELLGKFPELLWISEPESKFRYQKSRVAGGCAVLQPSLIPLNEQRAMMLLRDYTKTKRIFLTRSEDVGHSWSSPASTILPNPDSGISALRLCDGTLIVAYNDSAKDRGNLALAISSDEGKTWRRIATLENDDEKSFSYPYLFQSSDGTIRLTYSWDGTKIKMITFNAAWLHAQETKAQIP